MDGASSVGRYAVLFPRASLLSSNFGAYSYLQADAAAYNAEIGPFCSIAAGAIIGLATHPTWMVSTSPVFYDPEQPLPRFLSQHRSFTDNLPRTAIGADVWIGQSAMIKAGVRIGVGVVVGAGAIVTKDVLPYLIVAGNPAHTIRSRFDPAIVSRLLESRWWELEDSVLEQLADRFVDPADLLDALESSRSR